MAFPTYTHAVTSDTSGTTHNWTLPSGNAAGKWLILLIANDGAATVGGLTGFTQLGSAFTVAAGSEMWCYYKLTDGTETSGTFTTSADEATVCQSLLVSGVDTATAPELAQADAVTGDIDSPNVTASWGVDDNLFIHFASTSSNAEDPASWAGPSGYTEIDSTSSAIESSSDVQTWLGYKNSAAASDDPATYAQVSSSSDWLTFTIVVKPGAGGGGSFPEIAATADSTETTITNTHDVTMPSGITAGNLLLVCGVYHGGLATSLTNPSGFTLLDATEMSGHGSVYWWYKWATGSESNTTWGSGASSTSMTRCIRITGAHATEPPSIATAYSATVVSSWHPPVVIATWGGEENNLYLAFAGVFHNATTVPWATFPTNYGDNQHSATLGPPSFGMATREYAADQDDPSAFQSDGLETRTYVAGTIVIRPAGGSTVPSPPFLLGLRRQRRRTLLSM